MNNILEVKNLNVKFDTTQGKITAVNNISFNINKGECIGVAGESGSGKTQTFFSITGILSDNGKASGEVKFNNLNLLELNIRRIWDKNKFDSDQNIRINEEFRKSQGWRPKKHDFVDTWVKWAKTSINDVVQFLDENFIDWELVSAEEMLYEDLKNTDVKFKGFIDCVLKCKDKKGKEIIWVLDWKTSSARGWDYRKKRDFLTQAQIGLYKKFWVLKNSKNLKNVKCGFVLLKKGAKPGKSCELIPVSVGPKFIEKADKLVNSMINIVSSSKMF